jgi:hypothetical protein
MRRRGFHLISAMTIVALAMVRQITSAVEIIAKSPVRRPYAWHRSIMPGAALRLVATASTAAAAVGAAAAVVRTGGAFGGAEQAAEPAAAFA